MRIDHARTVSPWPVVVIVLTFVAVIGVLLVRSGAGSGDPPGSQAGASASPTPDPGRTQRTPAPDTTPSSAPAPTPEGTGGQTTVTPGTSPPPASGGTAARTAETRILLVNHRRVPCVGVGPRRCLEVRRSPGAEWELFYEEIHGFTFEPGYRYTLRVAVTSVEDPLPDESSLRYELIDVLQRQPV